LWGIAACIVAGAMLAAVDEALAAFGESRARAARDGEGKDAESAARYLAEGRVIGTRLLTGRVLALASTAVIAYELPVPTPGWRFATVGGAALMYGFAIAVSGSFAARRASRLALPLLRWARPLEVALIPFAAPVVWLSLLIERLFPPRPEDDPERVTEMVVEQVIDRAEESGSFSEQDAELLKSVLEFRETVAREIMVPRTSMVSIDIDMPLPDVVKLLVAEGHSRYPVYRDTIDHPIGILYAKDLFSRLQDGGGFNGALSDLVRTPVFFAAESQKISELLRQMQARHVHCAIVADEYGGTSGMVTLEDIIEEIVGEIRDEHDLDEAPVKQIAPGRFIAKADVSVHDLAEITGLRLPEGSNGYESLGGMIVDVAGRVPRNGESIGIGAHDLIVRSSDERKVSRVEVIERSQLPPAAE
jgi:CBS domain containing-hemolysin-like protein